MPIQTMLSEFITCDRCFYGRDLLGGRYGCRNKERRAEGKTLVNKSDFTCAYALEKEINIK